MDSLGALIALIEADRWIEQVQSQKSQLPEVSELKELESETKLLATQLSEIGDALLPIKKDLSAVGTSVTTFSEREQELERRLSSPTASPKELVSVQTELEHTKMQLSEAQNREVELFLQAEPLETELEALSERAKEMVAHRQALRESVAELTASLDEEIGALVEGRAPLLHEIPETLRSQYEQARSHVGGGVGAASVVNGRCEGCHISLSPLDIDRLKKSSGLNLMPCPECGRLLLP